MLVAASPPARTSRSHGQRPLSDFPSLAPSPGNADPVRRSPPEITLMSWPPPDTRPGSVARASRASGAEIDLPAQPGQRDTACPACPATGSDGQACQSVQWARAPRPSEGGSAGVPHCLNWRPSQSDTDMRGTERGPRASPITRRSCGFRRLPRTAGVVPPPLTTEGLRGYSRLPRLLSPLIALILLASNRATACKSRSLIAHAVWARSPAPPPPSHASRAVADRRLRRLRGLLRCFKWQSGARSSRSSHDRRWRARGYTGHSHRGVTWLPPIVNPSEAALSRWGEADADRWASAARLWGPRVGRQLGSWLAAACGLRTIKPIGAGHGGRFPSYSALRTVHAVQAHWPWPRTGQQLVGRRDDDDDAPSAGRAATAYCRARGSRST